MSSDLAELPEGADSDSDEIDYESLRAGSPEALAIVDKANDTLEALTEAGKVRNKPPFISLRFFMHLAPLQWNLSLLGFSSEVEPPQISLLADLFFGCLVPFLFRFVYSYPPVLVTYLFSHSQLTPDTLKDLLTQFESAFTLDQKCVDALLGKAYVQGLLFTPEETRTTLEKALEVAPNDPRVLDMLEALLEQEDEDESFYAADASAKDLKDRLDNGDMVLLGSDDDDENIGEIGGGADVSKLIAKDGVMTNRFREVLQEIFDRFSDDEHKKLQLWSDDALDAFHKAVNGTPIQPGTLSPLSIHHP